MCASIGSGWRHTHEISRSNAADRCSSWMSNGYTHRTGPFRFSVRCVAKRESRLDGAADGIRRTGLTWDRLLQQYVTCRPTTLQNGSGADVSPLRQADCRSPE